MYKFSVGTILNIIIQISKIFKNISFVNINFVIFIVVSSYFLNYTLEGGGGKKIYFLNPYNVEYFGHGRYIGQRANMD